MNEYEGSDLDKEFFNEFMAGSTKNDMNIEYYFPEKIDPPVKSNSKPLTASEFCIIISIVELVISPNDSTTSGYVQHVEYSPILPSAQVVAAAEYSST